MHQWTEELDNPFKAAYVVAQEHGLTQKMEQTLRKIFEWLNFDDVNFMDDLLQEIAGETNIVVQRIGPNRYRATLDE